MLLIKMPPFYIETREPDLEIRVILLSRCI